MRGGTSAGLGTRSGGGGACGRGLSLAHCRRDLGRVVAGREADRRVTLVDIAFRGPVHVGGRCGGGGLVEQRRVGERFFVRPHVVDAAVRAVLVDDHSAGAALRPVEGVR